MFGREGLQWPRISPAEMEDLMAYLEVDLARDPASDLARGQATLVREGCLKCHALRGEGASIGRELAQRRALYESPVAWAAAMWVHSPVMAAKARELGMPFPRFAEHELGNLVGFIRSAVK